MGENWQSRVRARTCGIKWSLHSGSPLGLGRLCTAPQVEQRGLRAFLKFAQRHYLFAKLSTPEAVSAFSNSYQVSICSRRTLRKCGVLLYNTGSDVPPQGRAPSSVTGPKLRTPGSGAHCTSRCSREEADGGPGGQPARGQRFSFLILSPVRRARSTQPLWGAGSERKGHTWAHDPLLHKSPTPS